jgi:hypothetical protein
VYNEFESLFKKLIFGENNSRLSLEALNFLDKKGIIENMDNYKILKIYCSRERPLFLPYYIPEKILVIEVARMYKLWFHFFHQKRKEQFIPLAWRIGEILLRGITKIDEFYIHLD